MYKYIFEEKM